MEAIAIRLKAIASSLQAIAIRLDAPLPATCLKRLER